MVKLLLLIHLVIPTIKVNAPVVPVLGHSTCPSRESERKGLTPGLSVESVQPTKDNVCISDFLALSPGLVIVQFRLIVQLVLVHSYIAGCTYLQVVHLGL